MNEGNRIVLAAGMFCLGVVVAPTDRSGASLLLTCLVGTAALVAADLTWRATRRVLGRRRASATGGPGR